jgi:hypothetical protein
MKIKDLKKALPYLFSAKVTPLIIGAHGTGKSQTIRQLTNELGIGFVDLRLGQMADAGDILGLADFVRDAKGQAVATKFMRPTWLPTGGKGILFLDEINRAHPDILQAIFQLVLDRKIHEYTMPEGWEVVAAMNPNTDEYVTNEFNDMAFQDRFCHIKFDPTPDEFLKYAKEKEFKPCITSFLGEQKKMIESDGERYSLEYRKPSRRSWEMVDRLEKQDMPDGIRRELVMGLIGPTATTAYITFTENYATYVKGIDILERYDEVKDKVNKDRTDMLTVTRDEIVAVLSDPKFNIEKRHIENLRKFVLTISRDLGFTFIPLLAKVPKLLEDDLKNEWFDNEELESYFKSVAKKKSRAKKGEKDTEEKESGDRI